MPLISTSTVAKLDSAPSVTGSPAFGDNFVGRLKITLSVLAMLGAICSLRSQSASDHVYDVSENSTETESGVLGNVDGYSSFYKDGLGTLVLAGYYSYQGRTIVREGTLRLLSDLPNDSDLSVRAGATFDLNDRVLGVPYFYFAEGSTLDLGSGTLFSNGGGNTVRGSVIGSGTLFVRGGGLSLYGDNTFSGGLKIYANSTVNLSHSNAAGTGDVFFEESGGALEYGDGVSIANTVYLRGQDGIFKISSGLATHSGIIRDVGGSHRLTKRGGGTLALTSGNLYQGGTTVKDGILQISADSALGNSSGSITLDGGDLSVVADLSSGRDLSIGSNGGGIFVGKGSGFFDPVYVYTLSGGRSGSGLLTKSGQGVLVLSGDNTSTGDLDIERGTVRLSGGDNRLSTASAVNLQYFTGMGGGGLDLDGNNQSLADLDGDIGTAVLLGGGNLTLTPGEGVTANYSGAFFESGGLVVNGAGTVELVYPLSSTVSTTLIAGTLSFKTSDQTLSDLDVPVGATLNLDGINLNLNPVASKTPQIDGVVSGTGSITHGGSWTVNLTGANTFSGGLNVTSSGVMHLAHSQAAGTGDITLAGGPLRLEDEVSLANNVVLEGDRRIEVQSGIATIDGVISDSGGARRLHKNGSGELVLGGANTFSRGLSIWQDSDVRLDHAQAAGTAAITLDGGQLAVSDGLTIANGIEIADNSTLYSHAAFGSSVTFGGDIFEHGGSRNLTITGANNLSEVYLTGSSSYTGRTTIDKVAVVISSADNLGSSTGDIWLEGVGTLLVKPAADEVSTFAGAVGGSGDLQINGAGKVEISGALNHTGTTKVIAGTLELSGSNKTVIDLDVSAGAFLELDGINLALNPVASNSPQIDGVVSGTGSMTHTGTWTVNLTGANTFSGGVRATNSGTLHLAHNQAAGTGNVSLAGGPLRVASGLTVANNIILEGNHAINAQSGTSTLTGVISETGGSRQLTKTGDGTFVLSGANTFSGGLIISGDGAVQLGNAAGAGTGTIMVSSGSLNLGGQSISNAITLAGGTLTGAGTLNSPTITSGTIAPGNSPGLLSFNDALTLNAATIIEIELGGTTRGSQYDAIDVNGILTQAGTLTVTLIDSFSPSSSDSFQLFDATSIGGSFATTNLPTLSEGLSWNTDNLASTGTISVTGSAVPEPATFATLLGLFAIGFTAACRRR